MWLVAALVGRPNSAARQSFAPNARKWDGSWAQMKRRHIDNAISRRYVWRSMCWQPWKLKASARVSSLLPIDRGILSRSNAALANRCAAHAKIWQNEMPKRGGDTLHAARPCGRKPLALSSGMAGVNGHAVAAALLALAVGMPAAAAAIERWP